MKEPTATANILGRICDSCQSATCSVFCHADSAYFCAACDVHIHTVTNSASQHDRVHLCQACQRAPAAFICKADAASLCTTCDADIHSANPLARRHQRVPIQAEGGNHEMVDEDEAASWLLPNPVKNSHNNEIMFGGEGDEYLEYNSGAHNQFMDNYNQQQGEHYSVVPIKLKEQRPLNFQLGMGYNIFHTVSVSSMDTGIGPESTMSEMSVSHTECPNDDPPTQVSKIDREARVMRYREKKKMRRFEKRIRYASRKAYAESRPRIKGRFAKRRQVEYEVDGMFCSENGYGIVPSF